MPQKLNNDWLNQIITENTDKGFVKRMLATNPMTLPQDDGSHATHKMAWTTVDGQHIAYPTVLYDGSKLVDYGPHGALDQVLKTGNYIPFDTPDEADYFSSNYKNVLANPIFH